MRMTKKQHDKLVEWIEENFYPWDKFNHQFPANKIKELWEFEHKTDHYLDKLDYVEQEYIDKTMLECGFTVYDKKASYWEFNVSPESPAYRRFLEYIGHRLR